MQMKWNRLITQVALIPLVAAALAGCVTVSDEQAVEFYVAGRLAMEADQYDEALAELAKAIKANPKLSVAHAAMGDIYRKTDRPHQAAGAYERACGANPYAFRSHYNLGFTYQMLADSAEAARKATQYIRKAVAVYLRAVTLKPDDFDTNLNLAGCYYQQGKFDLAEHYCKTAAELDPRDVRARKNLGRIYDAQSRPYDAIASYKAALEIDVHQPDLLLRLAAVYRDLGRNKDAMRTYEIAARENPDDPEPHVQIGACHYHAKDYDAALASYQRASTIAPKCAAAYRGLGVVYLTQWIVTRGGPGLRDKALDAWQQSLELDSNQPDLIRLVRKYTPEVTGPGL